MIRQVRRSSQSSRDIINIYDYIYQQSPTAAERAFAAIQRTIQFLLDDPGAGRKWMTFEPSLEATRVAVVHRYHNYLVFYRATSRGIEVFRVGHGARELEAIVDEIELEQSGD